ncbi:MAG TPA: type II toxin-antitoxin system RelE/ParE family toxin [Mucilaginibacter sp.]|jgi:mRNA interferase RelE/StbE
MRTEFSSRFYKDLDKITQATVKNGIVAIIKQVKEAEQLSEIGNIKKLKGHSIAYRIRMGDYRIGIFYENETIEFIRIAHRKDIYNIFP